MALYPDDLYCPGCGEPTAESPADQPRPGRRSSRIKLALGTGAHAFLQTCAQCGSEVLPGDKFCQSCGSAQTG
jgi:uncharacterized OB-fold protein